MLGMLSIYFPQKKSGCTGSITHITENTMIIKPEWWGSSPLVQGESMGKEPCDKTMMIMISMITTNTVQNYITALIIALFFSFSLCSITKPDS
jgi:hypothetical protein